MLDLMLVVRIGEISSLNTLGQLAFRFAKVRSWATSTQLAARQALLSTHLPPPTPPSSDEEERRRGKKGKGRAAPEAGGRAQQPPSQYLATLCSTLIGGILREYEDLIVSTEMRILKSDASFVAEGSFVPLSTLLATFNPWMAPMASLVSLVDILQAGPPSSSTSPTSPASSSTTTPDWPPGPLIDLLHSRSQIGYTHISRIYTLLSISVQRTWISHLLLFLIHGQTPSPSAPSSANPLPSLPESLSIDVGPDPSSSRRRLYKLREGSMPLFVSEATRESILYVGRAVAMSKREGREIDRGIKERMSEWVREVLPMDHRAFEGVIDRVRGEVGELVFLKPADEPSLQLQRHSLTCVSSQVALEEHSH
jgi:gamma-tubulin complex component 4